jgi:hypothetical protein
MEMFSMKRTSLILIFAIAASGCAVTADGIGPAHRAPDANKVSQIRAQLQENAASSAANKPPSGDATSAKCAARYFGNRHDGAFAYGRG